MSAEDWYRNSKWNSEIASRFEEKLRRARRKEQYLRIQASMISKKHPEAALTLLDRYFQLPDDFDHAQAHVDRASAYLAMARVEEAVSSYEAALRREAEFPRLLTMACVDLPFLIATRRISQRYGQALALLDEFQHRLMFPVDWFKWHAAKASILSEIGERVSAKVHANEALSAASRLESGSRYHPNVGLVDGKYESLKSQMEHYRDA